MNEEQRDPDLKWIRSHWKAPEPSALLATRVLSSYRSSFSATRRKRWMWWIPIPVAAAAAVFGLIAFLKPTPADYYRAVSHPRLIIISQGEHP